MLQKDEGASSCWTRLWHVTRPELIPVSISVDPVSATDGWSSSPQLQHHAADLETPSLLSYGSFCFCKAALLLRCLPSFRQAPAPSTRWRELAHGLELEGEIRPGSSAFSFKMLNALKLSELLAKNIDPQLYPRLFVMSPNGILMAYSTPVDIKELRDQAALISMAWKEQESSRKLQDSMHDGADDSPPPLETLTIETQHNNIIVRAIQPSLLLVLVGGVPPSRKAVFRITPEAHADARYPATDLPEEPPTSHPSEGVSSVENSVPAGEDGPVAKKKTPSILSTMSQREKDIKIGTLHIQRKKIDALTDFIRADFDAKAFVMPDDSSFP